MKDYEVIKVDKSQIGGCNGGVGFMYIMTQRTFELLSNNDETEKLLVEAKNIINKDNK